MTKITIQFWIRHRGYVNIQRTLSCLVSVKALAVKAVSDALKEFNSRWPGARKDELVCIGIRNEETKSEITDVVAKYYADEAELKP